jgi:tripartite-type tricarboxylate transporter receptor subunit TctC
MKGRDAWMGPLAVSIQASSNSLVRVIFNLEEPNSMSPIARRVVLSLVAAASCAAISPALAQSWPSKPVTIVVPFPPGGGPDLLARMLAEKMAPRLGQSVIVENKPGAGALVGAAAVARAAADGHTVLLTPNTMAISPHVLPAGAGGGVDVQKDLLPVVAPATTPMVLVAHPSLGAKDLKDLVAMARGKPGMAYASAGNGSPMHFAGEMFKQSAGVDLLHVPYRGVAPSITGTLSGDTPLLFVGLGGALPHIRAGKLIPLAVTEPTRSSLMPEVPTATEQGVREVEVNAWYGVFVPAGTPATIATRLNEEINLALKQADVRERMQKAGLEPLGGKADTLQAFMKNDDARYGAIARKLNLKAQ